MSLLVSSPEMDVYRDRQSAQLSGSAAVGDAAWEEESWLNSNPHQLAATTPS